MDDEKSMLRVGIDASNIRNGGGQTHLIELIRAANNINSYNFQVYLWGCKDLHQSFPDYRWLVKKRSPLFEKSFLFRIFWQIFLFGRSARRYHCDIVFVPGGSYVAAFRPVVLMSQNMLPFELREMLRYGISVTLFRLFLLRLLQSRCFRSADGVIFLTDYARQGVIKVAGSLQGKTCVIPHGVNSRFFPQAGSLSIRAKSENVRASLLGRVRLIYVSIIDQYKHQWNVLEAVAELRQQTGIDLQLEFVGPSYGPALVRLKKSLIYHHAFGEWAKYLGPVSHERLPELYRNADIGVFASSCENLPIILLEMMACRLPIACSCRGPMPEVLGDAGVYFDPESPETLTHALISLLKSSDLRDSVAGAAYEKSQQYSWDRCAKLTFDFLAEVAFHHNN
jgi:glycosyltransferase involved in cell wall biosynthesis